MPLHESGEMYLETIYVLNKEKGGCRSIDVCERMGFSKPSVSRAVSILKNGGYIEVDKNGYLTLTEAGLEIAERTFERHSVLTRLLVSLGVDPDTADEDACKIEHDISNTSFNALKKLLEEKSPNSI